MFDSDAPSGAAVNVMASLFLSPFSDCLGGGRER